MACVGCQRIFFLISLVFSIIIMSVSLASGGGPLCVLTGLFVFIPNVFTLIWLVQVFCCDDIYSEVLWLTAFFVFSCFPVILEFLIALGMYKQTIFVPIMKSDHAGDVNFSGVVAGSSSVMVMLIFYLIFILIQFFIFLYNLDKEYYIDFRLGIMVFFVSSMVTTLIVNFVIGLTSPIDYLPAIILTMLALVLFISFFIAVTCVHIRDFTDFKRELTTLFGVLAADIICVSSIIFFFIALGTRISLINRIERSPSELLSEWNCKVGENEQFSLQSTFPFLTGKSHSWSSFIPLLEGYYDQSESVSVFTQENGKNGETNNGNPNMDANEASSSFKMLFHHQYKAEEKDHSSSLSPPLLSTTTSSSLSRSPLSASFSSSSPCQYSTNASHACCHVIANFDLLRKSTPSTLVSAVTQVGLGTLIVLSIVCGVFQLSLFCSSLQARNRAERRLEEQVDYISAQIQQGEEVDISTIPREALLQLIAKKYEAERDKAFEVDPRFSTNTSLGRFNRCVYENTPPPILAKEKLVLDIDRSDVAKSSYMILSSARGEKLRLPLDVSYKGEDGIDAGGLRRDWVVCFAKTFVDDVSSSSSSSSPPPLPGSVGRVQPVEPSIGFSSTSSSPAVSSSVSASDPLLMPCSEADPRYIIPRGGMTRRNNNAIGRVGSWYTVLGRFLGLAVRESLTVGLQLHPGFLFALVGKKPTLEDVKEIDPELYRNLDMILSSDDLAALDLCFTETVEITRKVKGVFTVEHKDVDLKPNGANIPVTKANVAEYVDLLIKEKYINGCTHEMEFVRKGFLEVFPPAAVKLFGDVSPEDLGKEIGGIQEIDVTDWQNHTVYGPPLTANHQLVVWFWSIVSDDMDNTQRQLLLKFTTSLTALPVGGFAALRGTSAVNTRLFEIDMLSYGGVGAYPKAHTCFNTLDLPQYPTREVMAAKLLESIADPGNDGFMNG